MLEFFRTAKKEQLLETVMVAEIGIFSDRELATDQHRIHSDHRKLEIQRTLYINNTITGTMYFPAFFWSTFESSLINRRREAPYSLEPLSWIFF